VPVILKVSLGNGNLPLTRVEVLANLRELGCDERASLAPGSGFFFLPSRKVVEIYLELQEYLNELPSGS